MSTVQCKNCGGSFDPKRSSCPYCGTMYKRGAYAEFRSKVSSLIDSMLGLRDDVQESVSRIVLSSLLRAVIFIAVIIGLAFAFSRSAQVNSYNDPEYDQKAYEEIVWMDENLDKLNEAYENGDYKTIEKMYYQQSGAVQKWVHYPSYCLKSAYEKIKQEDRLDTYLFQRMLHFIYNPEAFTGYNGMNRVDRDEYAEMRDALISELESRGYSRVELDEIYEKCANSYGYVDLDLLKQYVKEDGNG
ncbi:MAG: hypothetical protein IJK86_06065 [Lachnospiraceae bacterium]|nr:hypothetical protein [Lachnospiraceae bacterium]